MAPDCFDRALTLVPRHGDGSIDPFGGLLNPDKERRGGVVSGRDRMESRAQVDSKSRVESCDDPDIEATSDSIREGFGFERQPGWHGGEH